MKEFINVYEENQEDIEKFIMTTLKNNGSILTERSKNYKRTFQTFPSMELLYITDKDFNQTSPNIFRNKTELSAKDKSRAYISTKVMQKDDEFFISSPYIRSATGHTCCTVMTQEEDKYIFFDNWVCYAMCRLSLSVSMEII